MNGKAWAAIALIVLDGAACGAGTSPVAAVTPAGPCTAAQLAQLEADMASSLASATTDADFTLLLEATDGRTFTYSRGAATPTTSFESASTSKLVTAVVILDLVDRGTTALTLDSRPGDLIAPAYWPAFDPSHPATAMTLRHLLAFTSGFATEPPPAAGRILGCLDLPTGDLRSCVRQIHDANLAAGVAPGAQFYYSSTHLQIAGLMAVEAAGVADWNALFAAFQARTGLFAHSAYDLPSSANPRLAGGMHWTAEDYVGFLRALRSGALLSPALQAQLWASQRGGAAVVASPILDRMGEDWAYGFGNWVECPRASFDCGAARGRNSSPGAYGAYPFVDLTSGYHGIVARQGALGTFPEGVTLFRTVEAAAARWATRSCGG
jgi:CubicO group peptidase (beta-lactamase class C family)